MSNGDIIIDLDIANQQFIIFGIVFIVSAATISLLIMKKIKDKYDYAINSFFYNSFKYYLTPLFKKKDKSSFLYIYLHNEEGDYAKEETISSLSKKICERYMLPRFLKPFLIENQTIIIAFKDNSVVNDVIADLKTYLFSSQEETNNNSRINATVIYVDDIHLANSFEELGILLKNYRLDSIKNNGTDIIYFNQEQVDKIRDEIKMADEIDYAINNGGVEILLQPIYSTERKKYIAAETFLRLKGKDGQVIKPNKFIPIAIKYNKMSQIDVSIIKQSCEYYVFLKNKGIELDYISINASGYEIESASFANEIIDAINNTNISPDKVYIEVNDLETVKRKGVFLVNLNSLRMFGCIITISGFGAANSRLSNITELNAEFVKLSPLAVRRAFENEKAQIVLRDTIDLIEKYNMTPIAVGAETEEQVKLLESMNINYLQGRYYSDAISKKSFLEFMKKNETEIAL